MNKPERIFYLDFIRAISTIFIVIYHFNISLAQNSIGSSGISIRIVPNGNLGHVGVSLFFIISGAALMYTYQNDFSIKKFLKKRAIAIYPMFWMSYIIAFLYLFYINRSIINLPKWTFILTILGLDGYLLYLIPNFYILGEWFLGCIILLYLVFPLLRKLMLYKPKLLLIISIVIYFIVVNTYNFKMPIDRNVLTILPLFIFGMYFIKYIKNANMYQFIIALLISIFALFKGFNILPIHTITITGISIFLMLVYIGQYIKKLNKPFELISKYSYAIFLVHHVIINQLLIRFNGLSLSNTELYCLFILTCIIIIIVSIYVYKMSYKLNRYIENIQIPKRLIPQK